MVAAQLLLVVAKTNASAARIVHIVLMSAQLAIGSESWSQSASPWPGPSESRSP